MPKIDSQMLAIYQTSTETRKGKEKRVSERNAIKLIERADHISRHTFGNCTCRPSERKGSKYLKRLLKHYDGRFTNEGRQIIEQYILTGRKTEITTTHRTRSNHHSRNTVVQPNNNIPVIPVRVANNNTVNEIRVNSVLESRPNTQPVINSTNNTVVNTNITPNINSSRIEINSVNSVNNTTAVEGPYGKLILDFKSQKPTWSCHWFPMQETRPGGDATNNLYSLGGPLDKLDQVTGGKARELEYAKNRKPKEAGSAYSWWGHCNNAAEAACLLTAPKHGVSMRGQDGSDVKFTKNDIQGLLVKVVPCLVSKTDFKGERFNNTGRENPNDPRPDVFMNTIKDWSKDGLAFVLDIDRSEQVWNFPYDQVKIFESNTPPDGAVLNLPNDGSVKYYHIEMEGTGYKEKARIYNCYVRYAEGGRVLESNWVKTAKSHNNPDFMWRPHPVGDLTNREFWKINDRSNNKLVDAQVVYDIYMASLS